MPGDFFQGLEHSWALKGNGFNHGLVFPAQLFRERVHGEDVRQIALVVLHHERDGARIQAFIREIRVKVLQALDVLGELTRLTVRDEHDPVDSLKHEFARGGIVHLSGHGIELKPRCKTGDGAKVERKKIEEQRAIGLSGE